MSYVSIANVTQVYVALILCILLFNCHSGANTQCVFIPYASLSLLLWLLLSVPHKVPFSSDSGSLPDKRLYNRASKAVLERKYSYLRTLIAGTLAVK